MILGAHVFPPLEQPGKGLLGKFLAGPGVPRDERGCSRDPLEVRSEERVEVRGRLDALVVYPQVQHPPFHTRGHARTYTLRCSAFLLIHVNLFIRANTMSTAAVFLEGQPDRSC